jgi:hypothetical protein
MPLDVPWLPKRPLRTRKQANTSSPSMRTAEPAGIEGLEDQDVSEEPGDQVMCRPTRKNALAARC